MLPFLNDPLTMFCITAGLVWWKHRHDKPAELTPAQNEMYRNLIEHCHDAETLRKMAAKFESEGFKDHAVALKRRADWRSRPAQLVAQHEEIFRRALQSENVSAILDVATEFERWTATYKARVLREHAGRVHERQQPFIPTNIPKNTVQVPDEQSKETTANGPIPDEVTAEIEHAEQQLKQRAAT